jgi:SAM-dependent methyltransferase
VICDGCGHAHRFERGILWLNVPAEDLDAARERLAVTPTEMVPELGGWTQRYQGVAVTDPALLEAYLSLPYGDGSSHFTTPGYFANVCRFAEEFDFVAGQLPTRGLALDIGADGTWSTARLAERGLTCVALDITDHLVLGELYQTRYPAYARINVDMHERVFVDGSFDVVTAFNALHHSRRLASIAERIAAVLKPGGTLGFVEPYVQNAAQEQAFGAPQSAVGISENIHTIQEWHDAFDAAGLSLIAFATSDAFSAVYRKLDAAGAGRHDPLRTDADGCFVHYYQAVLDAEPSVVHVTRGQSRTFQVRVRNESLAAWATRGPHPVAIGYHVERLDGDGSRMIAFDNPRTSIASFLTPKTSRLFELPVQLPEPGAYRIEFDLVHEMRSWFKDRGGRTAVVECEVR